MRRGAGVVVLTLAVLSVVAALSGCGLRERAVEGTTGQIDVARDAAAKTQVLMIKTGIEAHIATTGSAPADVSQSSLGGFVDPWPTNPFTERPMQPGEETGDYVYKPGAGTSYSLSVRLSDGSVHTVH